jgi:hypothetical protein
MKQEKQMLRFAQHDNVPVILNPSVVLRINSVKDLL